MIDFGARLLERARPSERGTPRQWKQPRSVWTTYIRGHTLTVGRPVNEQKSDSGKWQELLKQVTPVVYGQVTPNEIRIVTCESWADFADNVRFTDRPFMGRVFRGQADVDWTLSSRWERYRRVQRGIPENARAQEGLREAAEDFLERFKDSFAGTPGVHATGFTEEDWMALARHHGVVTPLLDWTESPYVAAFFAFRDVVAVDPDRGKIDPREVLDDRPGKVAIWEIPREGAIAKMDAVGWVQGRHEVATRQRAQSGVFSRLTSEDHDSLDGFLESKGYLHLLKRYDIPRQEALAAMHDLSLMNITEATMYPDADGAGRSANLGNWEWMALLHATRKAGE